MIIDETVVSVCLLEESGNFRKKRYFYNQVKTLVVQICSWATSVTGPLNLTSRRVLREIIKNMVLPPWTPNDLQEFASKHPRETEQLQRLRAAGVVCLGGGLTSSVLTAGLVFQKSRNVLYALTAGGLSGIAGFLSTDVITEVWFETRSIDAHVVNQKFLQWWRRKCNL